MYRQAVIDLQLGMLLSEELSVLVSAAAGGGRAGEQEGDTVLEKEENMKTLIDECEKMLITEPESCHGSWGLIDCDPA